MQADQNSGEFEITIDFAPGEGDPARVFRAMSGLIDAFREIDSHLLATISVSLEVELVLDDIERGSLKARFRDFIKGIPDEALKEGEFKKVLGYFLLKSKHKILEWCGDRKEIANRNDVRVLEGELLKVAEETDIKRVPAYTSVPAEKLLSDINAVQDSLSHLEGDDKAMYRYEEGEVSFNRELEISNEIVRDVLTREVISSSGIRILKVKKPDYLGQSMWSFLYEGRAIDAKIIHAEWLVKFQTRKVEVKPGYSIKIKLQEEISYGYEGEIVHRHYEVLEVIEVIKTPTQGRLDL